MNSLILDRLTPESKKYLRGVWSLYVLFSNALTLPVVQLQNSTGNITQDFYGSYDGTVLTTLPNGNGVTVGSWMSTNDIPTAYVSKWYDQSYVVTGVAYNATATGSQRPILNMSTPYSVDGNGDPNRYFNLTSGTIVGNGTYTFSTKVDYNPSFPAGGIIGGGANSYSACNNLRWNGANNSFWNYWYNNDAGFYSSSPSVPTKFTLINYVSGNAPGNKNGTYAANLVSTTTFATEGYYNKVFTNIYFRSNWNFVYGANNDVLMKTTTDIGLASRMFWCINSSQAVSIYDRQVMESIDTFSPYVPLLTNKFFYLQNRNSHTVPQIGTTNQYGVPNILKNYNDMVNFDNGSKFILVYIPTQKYIYYDGTNFKTTSNFQDSSVFTVVQNSTIYRNGIVLQFTSGLNSNNGYLTFSQDSPFLFTTNPTYFDTNTTVTISSNVETTVTTITSNIFYSYFFTPSFPKNIYYISSYYNGSMFDVNSSNFLILSSNTSSQWLLYKI